MTVCLPYFFCLNALIGRIQFAASQLPLLQLTDCGMSIVDESCHYENAKVHTCFTINEYGDKIRRLKLSANKSLNLPKPNHQT